MIHADVTVSCDCTYCDKKMVGGEEIILCPSCEEEGWQEVIKTSVKYVLEHDYIWKCKDDYVGFESDKELEAFAQGIKEGVSQALFWVCERQDLTEFYEKEIHPKFEFKNNKEEL